MNAEEPPTFEPKLAQFAAAFGTDAPTAVALMVLVQRGIATRQDTLDELTGKMPVPDFHVGLVDDCGSGIKMLSRLLAMPRKIERLLVEKFARTETKLLNEVWALGGGDFSHNGLASSHHGERLDRQRRMVFGEKPRSLGPEGEMFGRLELTDDQAYDRLDLALRPRFLIEGAAPGQLLKELSRCHQSSGLFPGLGIERLEAKGVAEVLSVIHGARAALPELMQGGSPGATEQAQATFLLRGATSAWSERVAAPLLGQLLLLQPADQTIPVDVKVESVAEVCRGWNNNLLWFLDRRRWGTETFVQLSDSGEVLTAFSRANQAYLRTCDDAGLLSPSVRELPRLIAWVLVCLYGVSSRKIVVDQTFHYAELLRDRHQSILRRLRGEGEIHRVLDLARQLRNKIERKQPVDFRTLVRSFDVQKSSRYRPVLELMVEAKLIVEREGEVYQLASEEDLEVAMRRVLSGRNLRSVA